MEVFLGQGRENYRGESFCFSYAYYHTMHHLTLESSLYRPHKKEECLNIYTVEPR